MQFGIGLPNLSHIDPKDTLFRLAELAEELAFDAIWVSDHVFIPYQLEPNYPYSSTGRLGLEPTDHLLDPLITLSVMAGVAPTPRLGISVLIIPYRNPIVTAKMLVTLDVLSGGRVILGAGVGWMPEEFDALGASHADRGQVTDEYLQIFQELCTAEKPTFRKCALIISRLSWPNRVIQIRAETATRQVQRAHFLVANLDPLCVGSRVHFGIDAQTGFR